MNTRYELRRPVKEIDNLIYLIANYNGNKFIYSTGTKIDLNHWEIKNQYPKKSKFTLSIRQRIDKIATSFSEVYNVLELNNQYINNEILKDRLDTKLHKPISKDKTNIINHLETFIALSTNKRKLTTIKKFKALKTHLIAFKQQVNFQLTYDRIDHNFFQLFTDYLTSNQIQNNTIAKYIAALKTFLNWSSETDLNKFYNYKKFQFQETEQNIIHLTANELKLMLDYHCKTDKYNRIKDLFVFSCFTGLRFGDLKQVNQHNIKDSVLSLTNEKTEKLIHVHLTKQTLTILKKYNYQLPIISNQKANKYLKEIAKEIGLNDKVELIEKFGAKTIKKQYSKYEVLSFHDARKTFVTLSLTANIPVNVIMKQTGHTTSKVFNKYLNVTDALKASQFSKLENLID